MEFLFSFSLFARSEPDDSEVSVFLPVGAEDRRNDRTVEPAYRGPLASEHLAGISP